jgi:tetratricopeptide (TPR) repeat protein
MAEQLTRNYVPTKTVNNVVAAVSLDARWVAIIGRPGSGKSTVLAALIHPAIASESVPAKFLHAMAWAADRRTIAQVATDLAEQLVSTVPGFAAATRTFRALEQDILSSADEFERAIIGPLHHLDSSTRTIRIAIDIEARLPIRLGAALRRLTEQDFPVQPQILLTGRDQQGLPPYAVPVHVDSPDEPTMDGYLRIIGVAKQPVRDLLPAAPPSWGDFAAALAAATKAGDQATTLNLIIGDVHGTVLQGHDFTGPISVGDPARTLLEQTFAGLPERDDHDLRVVLTVLAAANAHSALPVELLALAVAGLGWAGAQRPIRDLLGQLGGLVLRAEPGTAAERVGLRDHALMRALSEAGLLIGAERDAHQAIAEAITEVAPMTAADRNSPEHSYAEIAEAAHLWQAGRHAEALRSVELRQSPVPVANREAWAAWRRRASEELGPTDRLTLLATARYGTWLAKTGDPETALALFQPLLGNCTRYLGPTDGETLSLRHNIAYWLAETGRAGQAQREFESLASTYTELLGPEREKTLDARLQAALATAKAGNPGKAVQLFEELIPISERVLGVDHWVTISLLDNSLWWGREIAHPPPRRPRTHRAGRSGGVVHQ